MPNRGELRSCLQEAATFEGSSSVARPVESDIDSYPKPRPSRRLPEIGPALCGSIRWRASWSESRNMFSHNLFSIRRVACDGDTDLRVQPGQTLIPNRNNNHPIACRK